MTAPVKKQIVVDGSPERAFRVFTEGLDRWWPREHHIGKSPMKRAVLEPKVGGRWYAVCEDGSECDTGKVVAWEPGKRVLLTWQITGDWIFDASFSTELEITFARVDAKKTRVTLEHRQLERYGVKADSIRGQLDDPKGWNGNLERYAKAVAMKAVMFYELAADGMAKVPSLYPAHKKRVDAFAERGELVAVGTFADPRDGSLAVFTTREAADEFVRDDPFVTSGAVGKVTIRDWNETLLPR